MPVSVIKVENEPILIATFSGEVTTQDMKNMFQQSADLMGDTEDAIYRITDARTATSNFMEMLGAIKEASTGQPGSTTDPRIHTTFVGTSTWITFARNALKSPKFGNLQMAAFPSMEEGLDYVRAQMRNENQSDVS